MYEPINVLIADDHKIFRNGFKLMFSRSEKIKVIGEAANGQEAIKVAKEMKPDVIMMDIEMKGMNGIDATIALQKSHPKIPVIALSTFDENIRIKSMIQAGAKGYLLKDANETEVQHAIEEVLKGYNYYSDSITKRIADMTYSLTRIALLLVGLNSKKMRLK
ncbi:MAG: response regulator [Ginsengibacter sp.]